MTSSEFGALLLRRSWLVLLIAATAAGSGYWFAASHKTFAASSELLVTPGETRSGSAIDVAAFTSSSIPLVTSGSVLRQAAKTLGADPEDVRDAVDVSADTSAGVITVKASSSESGRAAQLSLAVSEAFVAELAERDKFDANRRARALGQRAAVLDRRAQSLRGERQTAQRNAVLELYANLVGQQQEALADAVAPARRVEFVKRATIPDFPARSPARTGILGGLLGLIVGLSAVAVSSAIRPRLRKREELGPGLESRVIGEIAHIRPRAERTRHNAINVLVGAWAVMQADLGRPCRSVTVVGISAGSGVSTCAELLATGLTRLGYDCDVVTERRSSASKALAVGEDRRSSRVKPGGGTPQSRVESALGNHDIVIYASAPVGLGQDAAFASSTTDAVLVVLARGVDSPAEVNQKLAVLGGSGTRPWIVLNTP